MLKIPIALASASPRRADLLKALELPFRVIRSSFSEVPDNSWALNETAQHLARSKNVSARMHRRSDEVLLTADTIVLLDDEILHKPSDQADAVRILQKLSGRWHEVVTGVCMYRSREVIFSVSTHVFLEHLSREVIDFYVDRYQPYDKAGSYGIQEWLGWSHIKRIEGSYSNVMGLPTAEVFRALQREHGLTNG